MRSIWNGNISFGLVSIPIKMYPATEDHSVSFRQIHAKDGGRIRYRKVCELEDKQINAEDISKAYEDADGTLIPITDEDLARLPLPTTRALEIQAFVSAADIDPLQMGDAYYLGASGPAAAKPYALLREALKRSEKVAIAKYAHRGRERLGMLRVVGDAIAMHRLLWPDEVRTPVGVAPKEKVTVREAELDLADTLMNTLGEVDLNELHDEYHEALEALVAAKMAGATPTAEPGEAPAGAQVVDLMAALRDSVRSAREARGEEAGEEAEAGEAGEEAEATVHPLRARKKAAAPAKKAPAGKRTAGAAKKSAAKGTEKAGAKAGAAKTTAKKAAAKKAPAKKQATGKRAGGRTAS
ncbi:Ku protein [Streptomyces sp. ME19-01-6]|uniref:non-homologous end joining protein Ku n=1 Tax=Streptomyces sp. ME19-01-6 TaxID=3028686 RepID=UPI0029AAEA82|nr:Ku protein [Streptomyces sp. ME19-01-6]MDX3226307.1 Ku protein [Streptomyces sp. ME19-01-6]